MNPLQASSAIIDDAIKHISIREIRYSIHINKVCSIRKATKFTAYQRNSRSFFFCSGEYKFSVTNVRID